MEPFLDSQSLSTVASCSTPQTPSPPMEESYGLVEPAAQYYLEYQTPQHQQQTVPLLHQQPLHPHHQHQHQQQRPIQSQLIDISHPSATATGSLYRRASFPFVHHDHPMSPYPKVITPDGYVPEHHHQHHQQLPPHHHQHDGYDYEDAIKLEQASAMVVPTQIPHPAAQAGFYRPGSSSSSVSSVSGAPPSSYLNPNLSSIPIMHTDDAASKETQYLRRKCFNCGTTEPPSWRRSTLNPGKIVCNKCGLYERTHNKPRPHQFGLRPGNKARKQPHPTHSQYHQQPGKIHTVSSPSSSPKRHGLSVKKEPLDYSQAMRRGSIASINSGSGTSDWDDHSGYSTASSAYPSTLGMAPPQHHSMNHHHQHPHQPLPHHHHSSHQSHAPNHHGHHPYNNALSMPPPRSTSTSIRLPQAPPMKVPSTRHPGSSSPVTGTGVIVPGNLSPSGHGGSLTSSPDGLLQSSSSSHADSPYGAPHNLAPNSSLYGNDSSTTGNNSGLRGPPILPSADYYARRGSTSQIPHQQSSQFQHDHLAMMRRGSVGAIGMGMTGMSFADGSSGVAQARPPLPTNWQSQQAGTTAGGNAPMPVPLSEMSVTPAPATVGGSGGYNSADSTPRRSYGTGDLTPSPPQQLAAAANSIPMLRGVGSGEGSPMGTGIPPEITSLTV